jgi:hypothetical protein
MTTSGSLAVLRMCNLMCSFWFFSFMGVMHRTGCMIFSHDLVLFQF